MSVVARDAFDHRPALHPQKRRRTRRQCIRALDDGRALGQRIVRHFIAWAEIRRADRPRDLHTVDALEPDDRVRGGVAVADHQHALSAQVVRHQVAKRADRGAAEARLAACGKSAGADRARHDETAARIEHDLRFEHFVVVADDAKRTLGAERMSRVVGARESASSDCNDVVVRAHVRVFRERREDEIRELRTGEQRIGIRHRVAEKLAHARGDIHVQRREEARRAPRAER